MTNNNHPNRNRANHGPYAIVYTRYYNGPSARRDLVTDEWCEAAIFEDREDAVECVDELQSERYYLANNEYQRPRYRIYPVASLPDYMRSQFPDNIVARSCWAGKLNAICGTLRKTDMFTRHEIDQVRNVLMQEDSDKALSGISAHVFCARLASALSIILDRHGHVELAVKMRLAMPAVA